MAFYSVAPKGNKREKEKNTLKEIEKKYNKDVRKDRKENKNKK